MRGFIDLTRAQRAEALRIERTLTLCPENDWDWILDPDPNVLTPEEAALFRQEQRFADQDVDAIRGLKYAFGVP